MVLISVSKSSQRLPFLLVASSNEFLAFTSIEQAKHHLNLRNTPVTELASSIFKEDFEFRIHNVKALKDLKKAKVLTKKPELGLLQSVKGDLLVTKLDGDGAWEWHRRGILYESTTLH